MKGLKYLALGAIVVLTIIVSTSCTTRDPKALQIAFYENKLLFFEVKDILDTKRLEMGSDYICINEKVEESQFGKYRVFVSFPFDYVKGEAKESKRIGKLNDIFAEGETEKIEKIFSKDIIYIECSEGRCVFAQKGLLDCNDEILFTSAPEELEKYAEKDDDEIIKKLNNNWYVYGER